MRDLREHFNEHVGGRGDPAMRACRAGRALGERYTSRLEAAYPRAFSRYGRAQVIEAGLRKVPSCMASPPALLFGAPSPRVTEGVFGSRFQAYHAVIDSAARAWDGVSDFEQEIETAVSAMPLQYPLTNEELDALAAMVELTISSFADAAQLPLPDHPDDEYELALVFGRSAVWPGKTFWKKVITVVVTDVAGFAGAAVAHYLLDEDEEGYEFTDSLVAGAASAVTGSAAIAGQCVMNVGNCRSTGP
jgi:hypothetical protein